MSDPVRFASAELLNDECVIVCLTDGTFFTLSLREFLEKFPDRPSNADLKDDLLE